MTAQSFETPQVKRGASKRPRNQVIEALRIVSAYGIVAFHSGARFHDVAYSGLIIFLILAPMADVRFNWDRTRSIGQLARVLLIPWVFWWGIYGIRNIATHEGFFATPNLLVGILYGTSAHLWFLPYIFVVLVLLNAIKKRVSPRPLFWISTVVAAVLLTTVTVWRPPSSTWELPLPQWIHALPAVCIGIVLGLSERIGKTAIFSGLVVAGAVLVAIISQLPGIGVPYAIGTILTVIAVSPLAMRLPVSWSIQPVADCMLGVFLTHVLWMQLFSHFAKLDTYFTVTLTFTAALITVFAARHLTPASRLIFG